MTSSKVPLKRAQKALSSSTKIIKESAVYWGQWRPRRTTRVLLGQTLNFVQISNGQAVPLGPGLQLGKYQIYVHAQSGDYWTYLVNSKHT